MITKGKEGFIGRFFIAAALLIGYGDITSLDANMNTPSSVVEIWEPSPAPNRGHDWDRVLSHGRTFDEDWENGSFSGLVARGNFVVGAVWQAGNLLRVEITSRSGGECRLAFAGGGGFEIRDGAGTVLTPMGTAADRITFATTAGGSYRLSVSDEP
jgi:alpha-L-fucosidase 2